jgi:hypothetical protein
MLTSCNIPGEPTVANLTLPEIEQRLNGYWRQTEETLDGQRKTDFDPDRLHLYEFEGLKGTLIEQRDHHDGTFGLESCSPVCELKEVGGRKLIEYLGPGSRWQNEILKITTNELVLASARMTLRYERVTLSY